MLMSKIYKLSFIMLLSLIFTGCASMSHNHHGSMSMSDKSCCCKSDSKSDSKSCSMSKKHENNKSDLPMSNNSIDMSMKNEKKMSCCNNKSMKESGESDKRDKGCSMCMKGKKDNQKVSFNKLDNNSDGKISISEYLDNPNQEFDTLDSDRDGFLTKDELNSKESSDPHAHH